MLFSEYLLQDSKRQLREAAALPASSTIIVYEVKRRGALPDTLGESPTLRLGEELTVRLERTNVGNLTPTSIAVRDATYRITAECVEEISSWLRRHTIQND